MVQRQCKYLKNADGRYSHLERAILFRGCSDFYSPLPHIATPCKQTLLW